MTQKQIHEAQTILCKGLKKDKDLYFAYQSAIAMSFYDEFRKVCPKTIDEDVLSDIANQAAVNFLNIWINK